MRQALGVLLLVVGLVAGLSPGNAGRAASQDSVTLFAAASTTDAITAVAELYAAETGGRLNPVFAASSTLARQIANGAPADIYLSANRAWMDDLERRGAIDAASRRALLSNRLVIVASRSAEMQPDLTSADDFAASLGDGRLAIGDPDHVPAGIYAKAALQKLGLWPALAGKLVYTANVRAALALADRGEVVAAIVYASDTQVSDRLRQVAAIPANSHPPILYPIAMVSGRQRPAVQAAFDFLRSPKALALFADAGFGAGGKP